MTFETPADRELLPQHQRREQIRRLVDERGFVRVSELREAFGVSGVTARADLDALETEGLVHRVHGERCPRWPRGRRSPRTPSPLSKSRSGHP
ncbi:DeoR family transcriptional regulator [Cryobacterium sp. 10C3]|uniref:DeoR family transcriptional regulator n=1 Tax=Cryobacterium sp. 10C3 TaxID=3048577 RepID=UPI002AB4E06F|nr:DeoR family transcriptional regulator [Cryobacterium sp. 10C3]MDY7558856.1 DeoR family transcriptional regulator [Cryobacterium sp. 10C3]